MMDLDAPVLASLPALLAVCNPLKYSPWRTGTVSVGLIQHCINTKQLRAEPLADRTTKAKDHAARIAWLVVNGWDDPIEIDVGVPSLGCHVRWPVLDGNHRLAAAAFKKDKHILANVSGEVEYAAQLLKLKEMPRKGRSPRP
jgi:hypothetical protein